MGSYTEKLGLYKADPITDGDDTFNINKMLNENWEKVDETAGVIVGDDDGKTYRWGKDEKGIYFEEIEDGETV